MSKQEIKRLKQWKQIQIDSQKRKDFWEFLEKIKEQLEK